MANHVASRRHIDDFYDPSGYSNYRLYYINGGGPRHSKYYRCTGIEQRLSDCENYTDTSVRTQYNNDVGVSCYTGK